MKTGILRCDSVQMRVQEGQCTSSDNIVTRNLCRVRFAIVWNDRFYFGFKLAEILAAGRLDVFRSVFEVPGSGKKKDKVLACGLFSHFLEEKLGGNCQHAILGVLLRPIPPSPLIEE